MNKKSQAKVRISNEALLVHFERVGSKTKFDQICQRWQTEFPQSAWNSKYKAWELPIANLEEVKQFCEKMFWRVKIEPLVSEIQPPQQLQLQ